MGIGGLESAVLRPFLFGYERLLRGPFSLIVKKFGIEHVAFNNRQKILCDV